MLVPHMWVILQNTTYLRFLVFGWIAELEVRGSECKQSQRIWVLRLQSSFCWFDEVARSGAVVSWDGGNRVNTIYILWLQLLYFHVALVICHSSLSHFILQMPICFLTCSDTNTTYIHKLTWTQFYHIPLDLLSTPAIKLHFFQIVLISEAEICFQFQMLTVQVL